MSSPVNEESEKADKDYKPHGIVGRMAIKPPPEKHARRSKRFESEVITSLDTHQTVALL